MLNRLGVILFLCAAGAVSALGKAGADPGAPAGGGDFVSGNAAVAAEVNKQINILYKALNDGTNSLNIDSWTNTAGALGYTGGNLGVGIAAPTTKFNVVGGTAINMVGATGFGVFGATTGNHVAVDSTQIQAKSNATTAANIAINPGGGSVGVGTTPLAKFHVNGGSAVTLAATTGYAVFGLASGNHLALSTDQIQAKSTATASGDLYVNPLGGNVGINTGSVAPSNALEVANFGATAIRGIATTQYSSDITNGMVTARKARGTPAAPAAILSGDQIGVFSMQGYDGTGFFGAGYTIAVASENWTGSAHGTRIVFATTANGSTTTSGRVRIEDNGDVAIGNVTPSVALHIVGAACSTVASGFNACASDGRLKKDIEPLADALATLLRLNVRSWRWNNLGVESFGFKENAASLGLIAQEVEEVNPAWVSVAPNGYKRVEEGFLKFYTLRAIQQLHQNGIVHKAETDTQILALQKRATDAEQKLSVAVSQSNRDKAAAEARAAKLERLLAEESNARKQQELRLAQLEQNLNRVAMRLESQGRVVARK